MASEPGPDLPGPSPGPLRVECECGWTTVASPTVWHTVEERAQQTWAAHKQSCDGESRSITPVNGGEVGGD